MTRNPGPRVQGQLGGVGWMFAKIKASCCDSHENKMHGSTVKSIGVEI